MLFTYLIHFVAYIHNRISYVTIYCCGQQATQYVYCEAYRPQMNYDITIYCCGLKSTQYAYCVTHKPHRICGTTMYWCGLQATQYTYCVAYRLYRIYDINIYLCGLQAAQYYWHKMSLQKVPIMVQICSIQDYGPYNQSIPLITFCCLHQIEEALYY